ncbi:hypothetical protein [Paraburkholderia kururiensis]|uniref:Uncharacterized protein n=1 Tax=Paraburkholderia kururiensis TaxID=984307 RepID=A0ABZ0WM43_9BURK|nr:hypothetical protein [Paraburkholderia kururiensis]WQD78449.1 hypothetical protein U0042_01700 [Paraburkholderia kururiensis]
MSFDDSTFQRANVTRRVHDDNSEPRLEHAETRTRSGDATRAPVRTRNWAWANSNETYDWMDSHTPVPPSDLLN